ncbi:AraC family transcriptional regulator [Acuticoccus sediminis]|uniref:AraC family transcriptional regulator n=1 Tax=Acuticoccus sediminis TaxID=2184697 RepID=UPI001CFDEEAD|nr:AraC family transcriptional regulator [Acuticoccus sediminis]
MSLALTRIGTVGPLARMVDEAGGSVQRLLRRADLPPSFLDRPNALVPLRDQFHLVTQAARLIGDESLPARLSTAAGLAGLGPYADHVMSFPTLGAAIVGSYEKFACLLQSETLMTLRVEKSHAIWSYKVTAPLITGRQSNELLALGYMSSIVRCFAGSEFRPHRVELSGGLERMTAVEDVFGCTVASGPAAAVVFPASVLCTQSPCPSRMVANHDDFVPEIADTVSVTRRMIDLEREIGRHGIDATASRMGLTRRTLQRRLADQGTTYSAVAQDALWMHAIDLLGLEGMSVTETAARLGYSDLAKFSRAFRRWSGVPPSVWRRAARLGRDFDPAY